MKLSEQWLRTWVNPDVTSEELAEQLTMAGLEVDDVSPVAAPFNDVVIGEVLTVEPHPDADRLRVTTVSVGALNNGEPLQIVCGAPNVSVGMKAPVAMIGAVLPNGLKIKKGKLRGVASHGMLCGASEIDLEDEIDGLLELPADAPVGQDIREYLDLDAHIIDISITPNRGDCFSLRGIAREVAVINQTAFNELDIAKANASSEASAAITVETPDCPRYLAQRVNGVDAKAATPDWMKTHLIRSGLNPKSFLVDVTNYVLMELGQPLHAFDADKIQGTIQVRYANAGEKLTLLDETEVSLDDDMLVIADNSGAIALAGVMGGLSTAVTESTQNVLIESAHFKQLAIAGRARRFGLHTDASQRFERGVDFELPEQAMSRAVQLVTEIAGGDAQAISRHESLTDLPAREAVMLKQSDIKKRLGFEVAADEVTRILIALGMDTSMQPDAEERTWHCVPPSYRFDIAIPEDLVEEVARIYGYDNIPVMLPTQQTRLKPATESIQPNDIHQLLASLGYQEAISFSFSDAKLEQIINPDAVNIALANPISADLAVMRSTLLSSLIPCVQYNVNRQQARVRFFELGLRFVGQSVAELAQIPTLAIIATGTANQENWHEPAHGLDFYDIKHDIEQILNRSHVSAQFVPSRCAWLHPGQSADIVVDDVVVGYVGALHPSVQDKLDLPKTWVAELDQNALLVETKAEVKPLSRFPQVRRDIALLVDADVQVADIVSEIKRTAPTQLQDVWLFDVYHDEGMPAGKHSLAFALIWQEAERTMEDAETQAATDVVVNALTDAFGAVLRG